MNNLFDKVLFQKKLDTLNAAKIQLKNEFFGIDDVIDNTINMISAWYSIPSLHTKPLVINLWGMTGVGKTSLIEKLVELLGFSENYFSFDLSNNDNSKMSVFEEMNSIISGTPFIFTCDEFQHAKTIDEDNHEIIDSKSRIIWEILGSGKFSYDINYYSFQELNKYTKFLSDILLKKYSVANGNIEIDENDYASLHSKSGHFYESLTNSVSFFSLTYMDNLYDLLIEKFPIRSKLADYLLSLNGLETIKFLNETINNTKTFRIFDCSKALIFIVGNLDEAYHISNSLNPDIGADILYAQSKKITLTQVKQVLKSRFRNEQIARLGNNHIIYPSLNSAAFYKIISDGLTKISNHLFNNFSLTTTFHNSVNDLIYKEGVFPSQGTRPVFTTIDNIITANIPHVILNSIINKIEFDSINFSIKNFHLIAEYISSEKVISSFEQKLNLLVESLRHIKNQEQQAIVAVHESGHAILLKVLLNRNCDGIISHSADNSIEGLTIDSENETVIISRNNLIDKTAVYLGGYAAEKLIFGKDYETAGSSSDFEKATTFLSSIIKKEGLGDSLGNYDLDNNYALFDQNYTINRQIEVLLQSALKKAEQTLDENYLLLINLSSVLEKTNYLNQEEFLEIFNKFAVNSIDSENKFSFYSGTLNSLIKDKAV